jgi:hypothetical protein
LTGSNFNFSKINNVVLEIAGVKASLRYEKRLEKNFKVIGAS